MGMINQLAHKQALERQLRANPVIPDAPDGPILERFDALNLARAIESEVERACGSGMTKLRLDMNSTDAMALASYLRRAVLLGA